MQEQILDSHIAHKRVPRMDQMKSLITMEEAWMCKLVDEPCQEKAEVIDSRALPLELRPYKPVYNPAGDGVSRF